MKQVVMDWDTTQKRIKSTWVWECNECNYKVISDKLPEEWEETHFSVLCEECK